MRHGESSEAKFLYPTTVEEAVKSLQGTGAVAVGGGTALADNWKGSASLLVDVTRCGIDRIDASEEKLHLGAAVRLADIDRTALVPASAEGVLLEEAAQGVASSPLRNAITLGGNIVHLVRWADMPVALMALDAVITAHHADQGAFTIGIDQLVEKHPKHALPKGTLVTGVDIPVRAVRGATYARFRTSETDYSLITTAVMIGLDEKGACNGASIAIGALTSRPVRAKAAEEVLVGGAVSAERMMEAAKKAMEGIKVAPNYRMEAEVRRRIAKTVIQRAIATALSRARAQKERAS